MSPVNSETLAVILMSSGVPVLTGGVRALWMLVIDRPDMGLLSVVLTVVGAACIAGGWAIHRRIDRPVPTT